MASFLGMIGIGRTEETFTEKIANLSTSLNPFTSRAFTPTSGLFARAPHSTFVLLIGLHESGKTTLMRDYLSPRPESVQTLTPGRHITLEELKVGPTVFRAYDIGSCRPDYIWSFEEELFERADAVIYFVDAADRETIMESREELIMRGLKADKGGMRRGVPLLVLATKIELEMARRPDQIETYLLDNISTSIGDRPTKLAGVNLKTGKGVLDALSWLSNTLLDRSPSKHSPENEKSGLIETTAIA